MTRYTGVTVFDGSVWHEHASVAIADGRFVADRGQQPVDLPGHAILPGFIDAHVHLGLVDAARVLRSGVTTVRDLGAPLGSLPTDGPRVLMAGQMLTARGGYPSRASWAPRGTAREVNDDPEQAVAEQKAAGACVIKVALESHAGPLIEPATLRAIVATAEPLRVTAHVSSLAMLERAIEAGVRELAHGLWSDEAIPASVIQEMVARGVTVVPTLHIDPSRARIENLRRFHESGGRIVYGTDMGNPPAAHGIDVDELRLMQAAGMTLDEALASATSRAAAYLGSVCGRIEEGAPADLVIVGGDPRADLSVLARPISVVRASD